MPMTSQVLVSKGRSAAIALKDASPEITSVFEAVVLELHDESRGGAEQVVKLRLMGGRDRAPTHPTLYCCSGTAHAPLTVAPRPLTGLGAPSTGREAGSAGPRREHERLGGLRRPRCREGDPGGGEDGQPRPRGRQVRPPPLLPSPAPPSTPPSGPRASPEPPGLFCLDCRGAHVALVQLCGLPEELGLGSSVEHPTPKKFLKLMRRTALRASRRSVCRAFDGSLMAASSAGG